MKGRRKKTKYSMVFATMVAMLSVCTAGVSTFAWFQASSEVRVSAASSSTTITVANPNETTTTGLYIFQDNYTASGSGTSGSKKVITGKFPSARSTLTSSDVSFDGEAATPAHFIQLVGKTENADDGSTTYYTRATSFLPGQRLSFAILIDTSTAAKTRTLSVSGFTSPSVANVHRYLHNGSAATSTEIVLADAINVYATSIVGTYDSTNKVFKSGATPDEATTTTAILNFLKDNKDSGGTALTDKFTRSPGASETSYPLVTSASGSDVLFLYTIEFGNGYLDHYRQVTSANTPTPVYVSPTFTATETTYWQRDDESGTLGGSSEVFQGLTFNITSLLIM